MEHSAAGGRIHRVEEAIVLKGTWTGPAAPELHPRALAPVASLPVLEVVSAAHILADLTLRLGKAKISCAFRTIAPFSPSVTDSVLACNSAAIRSTSSWSGRFRSRRHNSASVRLTL